MIRGLKDIFVDYAAKNGKMSKEGVGRILEISDLKELVDLWREKLAAEGCLLYP